MQSSSIEILFFLEGRSVPSSRFRVLQYLKRLEEDKIKFKLLYTRPSKYRLYPASMRKSLLRYPIALCATVLIALTRVYQILMYARRVQVIVLQRDFLFRVNSAFLERLLKFWISGRNITLIFDVDDAIYLHPERASSPALARKIQQIACLSDLVIAGNQELKDRFCAWAHTELVPTVVDHLNFKPDTAGPSDSAVICWTGQSSNYRYLQSLRPVFERLARDYNFRLRVIAERGAPSPFELESVPIEMYVWNENDEVAQLQDIAIGIMPLFDSAWERGKCGFKLLQYMALGKPAVASAVGVNSEIAEDGQAALLAVSADEWYEQLAKLLSDRQLRIDLGKRARQRVVEHYSVEKWYPVFRDLLSWPERSRENAA